MHLWKKVCVGALSFSVAAVLLCLLSCSHAVTAANAERPKAITVVADDDYPPYIFRNSQGKLQGILVDQWDLWEKETGIRVRLLGMEWGKALEFMREGKADVLDTAFITENRAKVFDFSKPYATIPVKIFFHKDIGGISGVDSLGGFTVGVKQGDACIEYLKSHGVTTLKEYPSYEAIIKAAAAKKIRVFCMDAPPALYYLNEMNLETKYRSTQPLFSGQFHRAFLKGRRSLPGIVEAGFSKISPQTYAEIDRKWMGSPLRLNPERLQYLLYFAAGAPFLVMILALWVYTLRKNASRQTSQLRITVDALIASEKQYRELVENANSIILRMDNEGTVTYFNEFAQGFFGYTQNEIAGKSVVGTIVPPSESTGRDLAFMIEDIARNPDKYSSNINENMRRNGERVWIAWTNTPIRYKDGQVVEVLCVGNDITERKRAEEGLREAEKRYRTLFEGANDAAFIITPEGLFTECNQTALRFFGCEQVADICGHTPWDFSPETQPDGKNSREKAFELLNAAVTGKSQRFYWQHVRKDGTPFDAEVSLNCVEVENGMVLQVLVRDITAIKQAETERKSLEERLQRAEKMEAVGTLAGGVAHDLNNVLGIVVGYSELLMLDLDESSITRPKVMRILKGGQRAAAIVQDLLTLARRGVSNRRVLNLNKTILECQNSPEFIAISSNNPAISIETDLETDLLNLSGSSVHLEKSFLNLVYNAAEAMPKGGVIKLRTRNQYLDKPVSGYDEVKEGDYVVFSISDTGEGIPAEDLKRIFEPFYTKKAMGRSGTGLGLAVVWGTVKDHQGYINVDSAEGKGTTFTLYFPVTREEQDLEEISPAVAQYAGKGESILVVDDVKEQLELACLMLKKLHYAVTGVRSGEEAVEHLRQNRVDLVVLDMIMDPGMDGLDTYTKILELHPGQKAIIVSGFSETERVTKAQALGAGAYVKKPYILEKLGTAIRKELDRAIEPRSKGSR
ncbi:MAG: PAS domain S-box protein [Syntrophobacteraceae bacterium]